jgi:hypothetical protein
LGTNFQSGLKIHFLIIRFFGNERRSVPRLQLHLGDIAYKFVVLYLFYYICLFQFLKHDNLFSFSQLIFYFELGGHLGWTSGSPDTMLEGGHPTIIPAELG